MATKTYSKEDVSVIVGGTIVKDFASVKVAFIDKKWTFKEGSHGEVTRSKKGSRLGNVTIILPQTNTNNGNFTAYCDADALVEVEVKDNYGNSIHMMPEGTFEQVPEALYEDEAGDYEWMLTGRLSKSFLGGNN